MIVTLWAAMIVGTALWGYGLFVTGTAPIIDWKSNAVTVLPGRPSFQPTNGL
jgi:hypothetical protein